VAAFFGIRPVTNPGVQQCGSPAMFAIRNADDVRIAAPGSPDEPANAAALRAQPRCHTLVDHQLGHLYLALGVGITLGLLGAILGLIDDRLAYRRAPRFESYLRERPADVPADPWDQPVVPVEDLGERLPDIEWREVRAVAGMSLLALFALPLLTPWSAVGHALAHASAGWALVVLVLVGASYPLAAAGWVAASGSDPDALGGFGVLLRTSVAASYTGRLLPEYGSAGLAVHLMVRLGVARQVAAQRIRALQSTAVVGHAALLMFTGLAVLVVGRHPGVAPRYAVAITLFALTALAVGVVTGPRRYRNLVVRPDRGAPAELRSLLDQPTMLASMVGAMVSLALVDALAVLAAVQVFGGGAPMAAVVFASLLATALGVLAPTPDGAGVIEAVLVLALVWAGVDAGPAVAAALLSRLLGFWLPMVPGWFALRGLARDGVV